MGEKYALGELLVRRSVVGMFILMTLWMIKITSGHINTKRLLWSGLKNMQEVMMQR